MTASRPGEEPPTGDLNGGGGGGFGRGGQLPPEMRPRVVVRFAPDEDLLVSGMLAGGSELANQAAVVDVPRGKGHVVMFANNPMWRNETQGSYFLLFNAMLNYDHLGVGVQSGTRGGRGRATGGGGQYRGSPRNSIRAAGSRLYTLIYKGSLGKTAVQGNGTDRMFFFGQYPVLSPFNSRYTWCATSDRIDLRSCWPVVVRSGCFRH